MAAFVGSAVESMEMNGVNFEPWVGRDYGRNSRWDVAVLLLGYSHYREFKDIEPIGYTQHVVGRHVRGINDRSRYWTKLARTFQCLDGRTSFWDSVAFYNYVQEFMSAPREDPTPRQVAAAWAPLTAVVERLRPDLIVATGKQLWMDTLALRLPRAQPIALLDGRRIPCALMNGGDRAAIVSYINHPSSGGYSYDAWCPVIAALLSAARERASA